MVQGHAGERSRRKSISNAWNQPWDRSYKYKLLKSHDDQWQQTQDVFLAAGKLPVSGPCAKILLTKYHNVTVSNFLWLL